RGLQRDQRFRPLVASYDRLDALPDASLAPQFEQAGIPLVQWEKNSGFSPRVVSGLLQILFSGKPYILHAHDLGPLIYASLAKALSFGRAQLVFTLHTLLHIKKSKRYRFYFRFFLRSADRIVAVSPSIRDGLIALGVPSRRIEVVPNGAVFAPAPLSDI